MSKRTPSFGKFGSNLWEQMGGKEQLAQAAEQMRAAEAKLLATCLPTHLPVDAIQNNNLNAKVSG